MKPDYYTKGGMECFDAIKAATEGLTGYEGFLTGNIVKYAWRWDDKGGVADLEKAAEYVRKLIELRASENRPYTLNELRALPDGARVWVESETFEDMWYTKSGLCLIDGAEQFHYLGILGSGLWRAWPAEPTPEQSAAWPWGEGGKE